MKYKLLGRSGLRVSELCLGCGTFGTNWGSLGSDKEESRTIFHTFREAGGNFIDTSNRYQEGMSESFLGEFINGQRDSIVLATKYSLGDGFSDPNDTNGCGNHRKNMMRSVAGSLKRLRTDYIDLLWVHILDFTTPIQEIMRALDDLVRAGKVLYVGASNFPAWLIAQGNTWADVHGWSPFIATQLEYSVVERSCEPEFLPMAHALDIGLVAWSALGGGMVTGKYNRGQPLSQEHRLSDHVDPAKHAFWYEATRRNMTIMDDVIAMADEIRRPPVQVSLRFLLQQRVVTIPVFSARTADQAKECLACLDFSLTDEQMKRMDEVTTPAITSVLPAVGPYPYPMLEYGSPALPNFYSRALLWGATEDKIENHRRIFFYKYRPPDTRDPDSDS